MRANVLRTASSSSGNSPAALIRSEPRTSGGADIGLGIRNAEVEELDTTALADDHQHVRVALKKAVLAVAPVVSR